MIVMDQLSKKEFKFYANFLSQLAKDMTRFYYLRLNKSFKVINKSKNKGYDPVTKCSTELLVLLMANLFLMKMVNSIEDF